MNKQGLSIPQSAHINKKAHFEVNPKLDTLQKSPKDRNLKGSCFLVLLSYRKQSIPLPVECNALKM